MLALLLLLTGTWTGQIPTRNGELQDIAFKLVQTGSSISGKFYRDNGSLPIKEGKVDGDKITFTVVVDEQVGNLFLPTRYVYSGTITNDRMQLTREREGPVNNELNGKTPPPKPNFELKRLF